MAAEEASSAGPPRAAGNEESQQWAIQRRIDDVFAKLGEKFGNLTGRVVVQMKPETTFVQIGGLREAKSIVRSFGTALTDPELYRNWGITPPKGVLLYGPPGTGEQGLARAGRAVEQHTLGRRDAPIAVELRIGEGGAEAPHDALGFAQAADLDEGGLGLHLHDHPPRQVAELLPELGEDVVDAALDRPLLALLVARGPRRARAGGFLGSHGLDARRGRGARQEIGLVEHAVFPEHGRLRANGEGDGVRGARFELHLAAARVENHGGVVDPVFEIRDHHARDRHLELPEEREEEIVSERARRHTVLEGEGDACRLGGPDAHGEAPLVALALEHQRGPHTTRVQKET